MNKEEEDEKKGIQPRNTRNAQKKHGKAEEKLLLDRGSEGLIKAGNGHTFLSAGAAGDNGFFAAFFFEPDLAVAAVAVPAEIGVGDAFHVEVLKAAEDGVVLWDEFLLAADGYLDQAVVGLEDLWMVFHGSGYAAQRIQHGVFGY